MAVKSTDDTAQDPPSYTTGSVVFSTLLRLELTSYPQCPPPFLPLTLSLQMGHGHCQLQPNPGLLS